MEELKQLPLDSSLQVAINSREYIARVGAIRRRLANANPGPWKVVPQSEFGENWTIAFSIGYHEETGESILVVTDGVHASLLVSDAQDDAEFIAHARSDVPWLLEQLDPLRAKLAEVTAANERYDGDCVWYMAELARKDDEIPALEELAKVNGELYAHIEMCIRKAAFSIKVTQEDDARHKALLARRDVARARIAEVRGKGNHVRV